MLRENVDNRGAVWSETRGSVCAETKGSLCSEMEGSIWAEYPRVVNFEEENSQAVKAYFYQENKEHREKIEENAKKASPQEVNPTNNGGAYTACADGNNSDFYLLEILRTAKVGEGDLGAVGNFIRAQAGSEFSKNLFGNYWQGGGDITLSESEFNSIVQAAGNVQGNPSLVTLTNGQPGIAKVHSFYESPEYKKALGSATIFYNQSGKPVGFQDTYNFNWRFQWGPNSRSIIAEQQTRGVSIAGVFYSAKPFKITYGFVGRP